MAWHLRSSALLHGLGLILHVPGVMALASLPISLLAGEWYALPAWVWTAVIALSSGQLLLRVCAAPEQITLRTAMSIAALGWAGVSLIGAIPFVLIAQYAEGSPATLDAVRVFQHPLNALFESVSGFTSTGLSLALAPGDLPASLHWWRSLSEWIGGVGVIVLMLSVIQSTSGLHQLYYSEARDDKLFPSVVSTVRTIWWIYLLYTVLSVLLLRLAGMPWWAALNHGMTGIATGGFAITQESIGAYGTSAQLATMLVMLLGSISFFVHYRVLNTRSLSALWQDTQHRLLMLLLVGGSLLLLLEQVWWSGEWAWVDTAFQWVSALSTCGFSTVDLQPWSPTAKLLLVLAMLSGAAAGSTSGGLKLSRLGVLLKGIQWRFWQITRRPHQLVRYELDGKVLSSRDAFARVESTAVLLALWGSVLLGAVVALQHIVSPTFTTGAIIFETVSALSNVGLSLGITHPDLPWAGKCVLMLCMWMGRLEIVPVAFMVALALRHVNR